jgi:glyoxylase-like metal-dependent hydrolase (beta-lactamase superfamily II)
MRAMMRDGRRRARPRARGILCVVALAACGGSTGDAVVLDSAASHRRARELVAAGLDAIGGADAVERAGGLVVEGAGQIDLGVRLQGMRPGPGDRHPVRERLGVVPGTMRVVYESHGRVNADADEWLRHDLRADGGFWIDLLMRRAFRSGTEDRSRYERTVPHLLLEEALRSGASLRYLGSGRTEHGERDAVTYRSGDGVTLMLLFDRASGLLREVEYLADLPLRGDTRVQWRYGEYHDVPGLGRYPAGYVIALDGDTLRDVRYTRVAAGAAADVFDVPADIALPVPRISSSAPPAASGAGDTAAAAAVEERYDIRDLAPGVHLLVSLRAGFHMLFVEFADHVLAVDAPSGWHELHQLPASGLSTEGGSSALGERYLDAIRSRVPDKPVRAVVLTHAHSDHAGGVLPFIAAGATVYGTAQTRGPVDAAVRAPHTLAGSEPDPSAMTYVVVDSTRVLRDDAMEVRLIDVGDNPHAAGMLAVYLPRQRLLYVSDLFEPSSAATFPSPARLTVMRWFVDWLDASGLEPDQIWAVHGSARVTEEQLERIRSLRNGS